MNVVAKIQYNNVLSNSMPFGNLSQINWLNYACQKTQRCEVYYFLHLFCVILSPICNLQFHCTKSKNQWKPQVRHLISDSRVLIIGAYILHVNLNRKHSSKKWKSIKIYIYNLAILASLVSLELLQFSSSSFFK